MVRRAAGLLLLCAVSAGASAAQTLTAETPAPDAASPFRPLPLPSPTQYPVRGRAGRGGYWQQRVDYRIVASLDTAARQIHGRETVHYTNNSPDAPPYLWMFVEQNICTHGQRHRAARPAAARVPGFDLRFLVQGVRRPDAGATERCRQAPPANRRRNHHACRSAATARSWESAGARDRLALHRSRLRCRPDGPRRLALRDRAVVPPDGGVRRRPGLEPRALHRGG